MTDSSLPQDERGYELLLEHCSALTGSRRARPPAYVRLEQALGNELARLLVAALATRRGQRVSFAF
jgi:hypothetical protein